MLAVNASVKPAAPEGGRVLDPQVLAGAAGLSILAAIDAALPQNIVGDSFLISMLRPDPSTPNATTVVYVARTLNTYAGYTFDCLLTARSALANHTKTAAGADVPGTPDALSQAWTVRLPEPTAVTHALDVVPGTIIGFANTSNASLTLCLPSYFGNSNTLSAGDVISGLSLSSAPPNQSPACTLSRQAQNRPGTAPPPPVWLVVNKSVSASLDQPSAQPAAEGADYTQRQALPLYQALSQPDAFNVSVAWLSFTEISACCPWERACLLALNGGVLGAAATWATQVSASTDLGDVHPQSKQKTFHVLGPGSGPGVTVDTSISGGQLLDNTQCLPAALDQAAAIALHMQQDEAAAVVSLTANKPPPGSGSTTSVAVIIVPVVVGVSAVLAGAAWLGWRSRLRCLGAADAEPDAGALAKLVQSSCQHQCSIPFSELRLRKQLGEGAFGVVWLALWHETPVAVKLLQSKAECEAPAQLSPAALAALRKASRAWGWESDLMASLRHPNVVLYLGLSAEPGTAALVMEYCSRGSLLDRILQAQQDQSKLPWALRLNLAFGAAKGMLYLHTRSPPILHRDLKARASFFLALPV
eukprot:scaffold13.g302.t1